MNGISLVKDALVFLFVYIPPLILFIRFWRERHRSKVLAVLLSLLYIIFSFFTQNLLPFILVIFNIMYLKSSNREWDVFRNDYMSINNIQYSRRSISSRVREDYERFKFSLKEFRLFSAIRLTAISYLITIFISIFESIMLSNYKVEAEQQEIVTWMANMPLGKFLIIVPIVIIFAPVLEEFVFRWLFFEKIFRPRIGVYFAAILSSLIFGFIHFNLKAFPLLIWIGVYNCYLIHKKGYWYSVFNHFVFNAITTTMLLLEKLGTMNL
ncbi:CPBP family intramembrane metalloprotease [Clostridium sp. CX1]|uniref:CPBP family intramembrane metalloprotease n=1 Tax=Clostridium tanneri TaxID=3037988 RepID=A0ABU4JSU6_9CLOT|nr:MULTISPECIES: CPBP family intramembrane glutamic endopeptidase [unclassified Clostridium]MCT8978191.1 CPBP family intramembrane metalloprotease [Clostridium sp. CX1]MDW8801195.1 CPBP family intramembrane metalloprotease [Clostridium sp. A1-XYC3]